MIKIWFHENEKALIYYDPLNHTAKRFPFTMFGKITTLYSEDAGERGRFFPVSGRRGLVVRQGTCGDGLY